MTRGQQIVILVIVILLLGVIALLAFTLLSGDDAASSMPTLASLPIATTAPTRPPDDAATEAGAPPTWTPIPTRTSPATSTPRATGTATPLPTVSPTFAPTPTPLPTDVVTSTPGPPTTPLGLENPGFEGIRNDSIPGWSWWAEDNFTSGGAYNPDTSFETPLYKQADDPVRRIDGPTLQIDAVQHLKFKTHVYQTVAVSPGSRVGFQAMAGAFSDSGVVQVAAGVDPAGGEACGGARWGDTKYLDQAQAAQSIAAPDVVAGSEGKVTVCLYAEPLYAGVSNAAFFDSAEITVRQP